MLAQTEQRLTQVHPSHRSQRSGFLRMVVGLSSVSTAGGTVLPRGVGEGNLARFASDSWRVCWSGEKGKLVVIWHGHGHVMTN